QSSERLGLDVGLVGLAALAGGRLRDHDAGSVGQLAERFGKTEAFVLHQEIERIATDVAHPALPDLPLGVDLQAGASVIVPRAIRHVVASLTAQLKLAADQIDNIR